MLQEVLFPCQRQKLIINCSLMGLGTHKSDQNGPSKPYLAGSLIFTDVARTFAPKNVKTPPEGRIQGEGRRQKPQPGLQCCSDLLRSKKFLGAASKVARKNRTPSKVPKDRFLKKGPKQGCEKQVPQARFPSKFCRNRLPRTGSQGSQRTGSQARI